MRPFEFLSFLMSMTFPRKRERIPSGKISGFIGDVMMAKISPFHFFINNWWSRDTCFKTQYFLQLQAVYPSNHNVNYALLQFLLERLLSGHHFFDGSFKTSKFRLEGIQTQDLDVGWSSDHRYCFSTEMAEFELAVFSWLCGDRRNLEGTFFDWTIVYSGLK